MKLALCVITLMVITVFSVQAHAEYFEVQVIEADKQQFSTGMFGTISETEEKEQFDGFIKLFSLAYGDVTHKGKSRLLSFKTDCVSTDYAQAALKLIEQYNGFEGAKVSAAIEEFRGKVNCWVLGRAGSPLLIARFPYWTH